MRESVLVLLIQNVGLLLHELGPVARHRERAKQAVGDRKGGGLITWYVPSSNFPRKSLVPGGTPEGFWRVMI